MFNEWHTIALTYLIDWYNRFLLGSMGGHYSKVPIIGASMVSIYANIMKGVSQVKVGEGGMTRMVT